MKSYLVDPFGDPQYLGNRLFDGPFRHLRDALRTRGARLDTYDLGHLASADLVLCFNYDAAFFERCRRAGIGRDRLVLFCWEPAVVRPDQYDDDIWSRFTAVFCMQDDLVAGRGAHKLTYPQGQPLDVRVPPARTRQRLTLINANKYSYVPGELYSLRRTVVRWFERHSGIDLYGPGWDRGSRVLGRSDLAQAVRYRRTAAFARDVVAGLRPYSSYRGVAADKYETLGRYRFSICLENQGNAPGYVTEKLFDCLVTGTVPVYLGAPNIERYVPAGCFIDLASLGGCAALDEALHAWTADDDARFAAEAAAFLGSEAYLSLRPEVVFRDLAEALV